MPQMHADSSWATGTVVERVIMFVVGLGSVVVAGWLISAGHVSIGASVLGIAVLAAIGFLYVALAEDPDVPWVDRET